MELSLEHPGRHLFIRSHGEEGIRVVDTWIKPPLVLSPNTVLEDWHADSLEQLDDERLDALATLSCDIILIGTGKTPAMMPPELMVSFYKRQMGVELMTTDAACRTFNVLASENRSVAAVFLA